MLARRAGVYHRPQMLFRKAPLAAPVAALAILVATLASRPAAAVDCMEAISEANARSVFDGLAEARPSDGCIVENVITDRSQMRIEWQKGGHLQEAILIVPSSCVRVKSPSARGKLSAVVPASVEDACPAAVAVTRQLAEAGPLGDLVPLVEAVAIPDVDARATKRWKRFVAPVAGGTAAAAAIAAGIVLAVRRRRKRSLAEPPQPVVTDGPAAAPPPDAVSEASVAAASSEPPADAG